MPPKPAAKTHTPKHGFDGRVRLEPKDIEDPWSGKVERKLGNACHDTLEALHSKGRIDDAQKRAGDRVRALHERSAGAGAKGIDYADDRVDGGGVWKDIPAHQLDGMMELARLSRAVGKVGYAVLIRVAVDGCNIGDIARMLTSKPKPSPIERDYASRTLKDALDEAAVYFGYQTQSRSPSARLGPL